jgi:hypothetical protein
MTTKRTLTLRLSFHAPDEATAGRKVKALLKWLLRSWRIRCLSCEWDDATNGKPPEHSFRDDPERWGAYRQTRPEE